MRRGTMFIVLSMACIGASIPLGDSMMEKFPVWVFTCITLMIATIILVPLSTVYEKTNWTKLGWKNYYGMFMQALLTASLYTIFLLYGVIHASAISVGIISSITPAVVFILSFLLLKEKLNLKKAISILLAIVAVLIMNVAGVHTNGEASLLGITFMLLAVLALSLFFIYAKKFSVELPPYTLAAGLVFFGTLQTLPMALFELSSLDLSVFYDGSVWLGILLYSLLGWVFAYSLTFISMPQINASTAGMANAVIPVVASVVAVVFYGASIRFVDVMALLLVIASIIIAEFQEKNNEATTDIPSHEVKEKSI